MGEQNAKVDRSKPYRTLVFFAPLSVGSASRRTVPTGFQMLRGALLAQKQVNDLTLKSQMPVRLLVANAGSTSPSARTAASTRRTTAVSTWPP